MSLVTAADVPMFIKSYNASAERRITPSWTISQLKTKLEPVTGIPPSAQRLLYKRAGVEPVYIAANDEEGVQISNWELQQYAEIEVQDVRSKAERNLDLSDLSSVEKYVMPLETYENTPGTFLAYKKANHIGRFDPNSSAADQRKVEVMWTDVRGRQLMTGRRCQIGTESARRGQISFVGEVDEVPGIGGPWIGVSLDEPMGKNDGTVNGKRLFECLPNHGLLVRPDRVEVGDYPPLTDELDSDLEEL